MSDRRNRWVTGLLLAALVVIFAVCLLAAPRGDASPGEAFGGTDSKVVNVLEQDGVKPWFEPLFAPDSSEVESGLFALQAALGAGVLGYVLGNLNGRRSAAKSTSVGRDAPGPSPSDDPSGD